MTAVHCPLARLLVAVRQFLTAIGWKKRPAILFQRRRDPGLFPAIGEKGATHICAGLALSRIAYGVPRTLDAGSRAGST